MKPGLYLNIAGQLGADKTFCKSFKRAHILRTINELLF